MVAFNIDKWPSKDRIEKKIAEEGSNYTGNFWKILQIHFNKKSLSREQSDLYYIIQQAHLRLTGYSLPATIKGARKTKAQIRDDSGPEIKDEILDKVVKGGLSARLKAIRERKQNG